MPSIESILTRELDLRFIDARTIATEARIALGIEGYPSKEHITMIRDEAVRIFESKSSEDQKAMQRMHHEFEAIKIPGGSLAGSDTGSDNQSVTSDASRVTGSYKSGHRRRRLFGR